MIKIDKNKLVQVIKEELNNVIQEVDKEKVEQLKNALSSLAGVGNKTLNTVLSSLDDNTFKKLKNAIENSQYDRENVRRGSELTSKIGGGSSKSLRKFLSKMLSDSELYYEMDEDEKDAWIGAFDKIKSGLGQKVDTALGEIAYADSSDGENEYGSRAERIIQKNKSYLNSLSKTL